MNEDTSNQIRREMPSDKNPWLRFQVGIAEKRFAVIPIYVGNDITEHFTSVQHEVWIFTLKGWGETMELAERMAGIPTTVNAMSEIPKL
jgi:hypothetical protein